MEFAMGQPTDPNTLTHTPDQTTNHTPPRGHQPDERLRTQH